MAKELIVDWSGGEEPSIVLAVKRDRRYGFPGGVGAGGLVRIALREWSNPAARDTLEPVEERDRRRAEEARRAAERAASPAPRISPVVAAVERGLQRIRDEAAAKERG